MHDSALLVARLALAPLYLVSGVNKALGWPSVTQAIAGEGLPLPSLLGLGTVALELLAPVLLILGLATRPAAAALLAFTVLATVFFHDFWAFEGAAFGQQLTQFLKNLGLAGGLAVLAALGAGAFSLDARRPRGRAALEARMS